MRRNHNHEGTLGAPRRATKPRGGSPRRLARVLAAGTVALFGAAASLDHANAAEPLKPTPVKAAVKKAC